MKAMMKGSDIRSAREKMGLSKMRLCEISGLSLDKMNDLEKGRGTAKASETVAEALRYLQSKRASFTRLAGGSVKLEWDGGTGQKTKMLKFSDPLTMDIFE